MNESEGLLGQGGHSWSWGSSLIGHSNQNLYLSFIRRLGAFRARGSDSGQPNHKDLRPIIHFHLLSLGRPPGSLEIAETMVDTESLALSPARLPEAHPSQAGSTLSVEEKPTSGSDPFSWSKTRKITLTLVLLSLFLYSV